MLRTGLILVVAALAGCSKPAQPLVIAEPAPPQPTATPQAPPTAPAEPTPQPAPPEDPNDCNPFIAPVVRTGGRLTINAPPQEPARTVPSRMRTHIEGSLTAGSGRVWVGPQVPGFVPLTEGTMELFLLDHLRDGSFLALYRDPYDASSCSLSGRENCDYVATLFGHCGEVQWSLALGDLFSRPDHLEVQDIRVVDGALYFNEACQTYSKDARGKCSSLVAVDPVAGQVQWRTRPLVSNGRFFVEGDYIVAGYGFTSEKDLLRVVRRTDGEVMQSVRLPSAPEDIGLLEPGVIQVKVYPGETIRVYRMEAWDTESPKLVELKDDPPPPRSNGKRKWKSLTPG